MLFKIDEYRYAQPILRGLAMNYSESQRTGKLAELDVEQLFTSWGWIVGHDHIDEGYDLHIEPDRTLYKGARFLIQVKGTARNKGKSIVAPVSKKRLRQYAENPIPVVIVRSAADRMLYWIHAQHWARTNTHKLADDGVSGVRLDEANKLSDRQAFEKFLAKVLEPPAQRKGALAALAEERSRYLSSLDARLRVRTSVQDGKEQHEIFAVSDDVNTSFQFQPARTPANIDTLRDAIEFGLPGEVEVETFRLSGSPVFDAIGASEQFHGKLAIQPTKKYSGFVQIRPGRKYSMFAPEFSVEAELFRGQKGVAISNQSLDSLFDVSVKLANLGGKGRANLSIGFRPGAISAHPIQHFNNLASIADWAEGVMNEDAMFIELAFLGVRMPLSVSEGPMRSMRPFLPLARILGKLHLVTRALNSSFTMSEDYGFSTSDLSDIELAFALLKGERRHIEIGPIELEPSDPLAFNTAGEFYITTTISFAIDGQVLGDIPVGIELPGFTVEQLPSSTKFRISKGDHGQALVFYNEHDVIDGNVRRVQKT